MILRPRSIWHAAVGALLTASTAFAGGSPRLFAPDDLERIQTVENPAVSPDGQWVAYTLTSFDVDADEVRHQIRMVSWDGRDTLALTAPSADTGAPSFSPDGRYVSYLGKAPGSESLQVMLLDRRGGEPRALTNTRDAILSYAWSPDGRSVALILAAGDEPEPTSAVSGAKAPPRPLVIDGWHFKDDDAGYLTAGHAQRLDLLDVASGRSTTLFSEAAGVTLSAPAWSGDGRRLALVRTRERDLMQGGTSDLLVADIAGDAPRVVTALDSPRNQRLEWRPDGNSIALLIGRPPKYSGYAQPRLALVDVAGGATRVLTGSLDCPVDSYALPNGSPSALLDVESDRVSYIARVDLATGTTGTVAKGRFSLSGLATGGGHTALLHSDDRAPAELYALDGDAPRMLTSHNASLMGELSLGQVRDLTFMSTGRTEVHGVAVLPPGYRPGRRYPTVLYLHGGPNEQDDHSFGYYAFPRQLLAARGYVVVGVNYRGSSGRGAAYGESILADWGHKEVDDVLAAADYAVTSGLADPARLGIGGWSYGGILTDYVIASDRRFKAAFSGAGSANQLSMYGHDEYIVQYHHELGPPWRAQAAWLRVSYPFFHADRIVTPTLFMGGIDDFNVPVIGGEQMYEALRTLGVPTRLVLYPGEHHDIRRPTFVRDRAQRIIDWFTTYLPPTP